MTTMATMIRMSPVRRRPTTSSPTPALVHGDQIADDHDGCAVESGDECARTQSERLAGDAWATTSRVDAAFRSRSNRRSEQSIRVHSPSSNRCSSTSGGGA